MHHNKNQYDRNRKQYHPFAQRKRDLDKTDTGDHGLQYAAGHLQMAAGRDHADLGQYRRFIRVIQYDDRGDRREREMRPDRSGSQASGRKKLSLKAKQATYNRRLTGSSPSASTIGCHRLKVRSQDFQSCNPGSSPGGTTKWSIGG